MISYHLLILIAFFSAAFAETVCNGRVEYCSRKYSDVSLIGSHDSPFVGELPQDNQDLSITDQLKFGVRFLQGQTHLNEFGDLHLCHTNCLLKDAGPLESFLQNVKSWMDKNPNEVITLLITNGDNLPVSHFDQVFQSSGIKSYAFIPPSSPGKLAMENWPTLQQLISSTKRLVVFLDYGADMASVPYILDEFSYFFETPYDVTDPHFQDCSINRPPGANANERMYIVNHFLDVDFLGILIPDRLNAARTNAATGDGSIGAQVDLCKSIYDRSPNFVLVDFINEGNVLAAQNSLNGV